MAPGTKTKKFTYKSQRRNTERKETFDPRKTKRAHSAAYDDEARRDYLTGFSKRKKARKEAGRAKVEESERLERNELRAQVREQLRQRAQDNVRAAHEAYGDPIEGEEAGEDGHTSTAGSEAHEAEDVERHWEAGQHQFDNEEALTTVTVEPFDAEQDEQEQPEPSNRPQGRGQRGRGGGRGGGRQQHQQQRNYKPQNKYNKPPRR